MPDAYSFLLDAPTGEPRSRIQIAKLGRGFKDGRYGTFDITSREVQSWQRNLAKLPGGRAAIDLDHAADRPGAARSTEAAGWITAVELDDGVPMATVEWTPVGEAAIREKRYLFFSPTYGPWTDEQGQRHPDTLIGGALTNRPFLNMPTVCLAAEPFAADAPASPPTDGPPDSRPAMPDLLKTLAATFGLAEDADEATVLAAAKAAAKPAPPPKTDTRTLATMAEAEGFKLLSAADHATLTDAALQGVQAAKELSDMRFSAAFDAALRDGKLDAKPETRELHAAIYAADADRSLKLLASLPAGVVNLSAKGEGGDPDGDYGDYTGPKTLDGDPVDIESAKQLARVEKLVADGKDFDEALRLVAGGAI